MLALDVATYLGPATVANAGAGRAKVELPDGRFAWAQVALAFPYQPVADDVVLAIGRDDDWYVIGVLKGTGPTTLTVPGDLTLAAPRGKVVVEGAAVELRSPDVKIAADRLETVAKTVLERFATATRWVKETFQLRVGRWRTRVDGTYTLQADRIREVAERDVKIDGERINLG